MAGCNECKFHKSDLPWDEEKRAFGDLIHSCSAGKEKEVKDWWQNNGEKKRGENLDDMDCQELTESTKKLTSMERKIDEILEIISRPKTN